MIAGGIGTIVQRAAGLNSLSLEGFAVFMVVFVVLRFFLDAVSPSKELSQVEKELIETKRRVRNKKIFKFLQIVFLIVGSYLFLNFTINYLFFKTEIVYNKDFKYNYNTSKATVVSFKHKIATFKSDLKGYLTIIKKDDKYYILQTQNYPRKDKQYLTIYDDKYIDYDLSNILKHIEKLQNGLKILTNLQFTAYKEVCKFDMITEPLWLINPPVAKLSKWDQRIVKSSLKRLKLKPLEDMRKKLRAEQKKFTKKDLSKLSAMQLAEIFDKLYTLSGFEYYTNYAIKVYKEFIKRDKKAKYEADKKYQFYSLAYNLSQNMDIYINNKKLNKILKKYDLGIAYRFNYPILTPFDNMEFAPYSYIMIYDFKNDTKTPIFTNEIDKASDITMKDNKIIINRLSNKPYVISLEKADTKKAYKLLVKMVKDFVQQEKLFYGLKRVKVK
jgi:hypothetical protein